MGTAEIIVPTQSVRQVGGKDGVSEWFAEYIQELAVKKVAYTIGAMSEEESREFEFFAEASEAEIISYTGKLRDMYFSKKIVFEYVKLIRSIPKRKLAFDLSGSEILVWLEIDNDREDIERELILAEAKINANFYDTGFRIDSMIVEKEDSLKTPNHYITLQTQDSA